MAVLAENHYSKIRESDICQVTKFRKLPKCAKIAAQKMWEIAVFDTFDFHYYGDRLCCCCKLRSCVAVVAEFCCS